VERERDHGLSTDNCRGLATLNVYINFDNDNDRSYRRPSITVIIQNTLRASDDDAITDVTTVNKQNSVSYVLLSFQLRKCTTGNMCSYIYDQIYAIRTCERFRE